MQKKNGLRMAAAAIIFMQLTTAGCATTTSKGTSGAAIGAATGAIAGQAIGHDTKGTLIGAAVGGLLGYIVGNEMDKYDQAQLNQVYATTRLHAIVRPGLPGGGNYRQRGWPPGKGEIHGVQGQ